MTTYPGKMAENAASDGFRWNLSGAEFCMSQAISGILVIFIHLPTNCIHTKTKYRQDEPTNCGTKAVDVLTNL